MSDNEIRKILAERKREAKREQIKETVEGILCWTCWAGLGYMMFLGAHIVG